MKIDISDIEAQLIADSVSALPMSLRDPRQKWAAVILQKLETEYRKEQESKKEQPK